MKNRIGINETITEPFLITAKTPTTFGVIVVSSDLIISSIKSLIVMVFR